MALQIRRGPTADRMSYTPVVGELIWDTSTNSLYIGNGTTAGGLPAGTLVTEDVQDIASSMLINGTHQNITFTYDDTTGRINSTFDLSTFNGTLTADGFIGSHYANDSTLLLNALTGAVNLNGTVKGHIVPSTNIAYDLGSSSFRFRDLYLSGSSIILGSATITSTGSTVNLPAGSTINGTIIGTGVGAGVEAGMNYNINIVGDDSSVIVNASTRTITAAGGFTGDLTGSVFADDSSILVDGVDGVLRGTHIGALTGNVTGNVTGSVTGNIFTNFIDSADSSPIIVTPTVLFNSNVTAEGSLRVVDGGNFQSTESSSFPLAVTAAHNDDQATRLVLRRSRGTLDTPLSLITNDRVGSIQFNGYDGTSTINAATIQARVTGTVSSGVMPSSLRFLITNTLGNEHEAGRFNDSGNLFLFANDVTSGPLQIFSGHNSSSNASNVILVRARGVPSFPGQTGTPLAVQNGDPIFDFAFAGYDGTNNTAVAQMRVVTDGAVSTGIVPGRFEFFTSNTSGVSASRLTVATTKTTFNNMPVLPTYADETAADTAIGGSGNRVNGMMYYDTGAAKIKAVAGGSWTAIH